MFVIIFSLWEICVRRVSWSRSCWCTVAWPHLMTRPRSGPRVPPSSTSWGTSTPASSSTTRSWGRSIRNCWAWPRSWPLDWRQWRSLVTRRWTGEMWAKLIQTSTNMIIFQILTKCTDLFPELFNSTPALPPPSSLPVNTHQPPPPPDWSKTDEISEVPLTQTNHPPATIAVTRHDNQQLSAERLNYSAIQEELGCHSVRGKLLLMQALRWVIN